MMADVERDLAVHVAVCDERYKQIADSLREGEKRMAKIEFYTFTASGIVIIKWS